MLKKMMALLLAAAMLVLSACSGGTQTNSQGSADTSKAQTSQATSQAQTSQGQASQGQTSEQASQPDTNPGNEFVLNADGSCGSGGIAFPLKDGKTYTWYRTADANLLDVTNGDLNNNEFLKEFALRTNVHFEFNVPAIGTEQEKFTQMFISNALPDIISGSSNYTEGLDGGVDDGYYMDLTELIPQYMPDYMNVLREQNLVADMLTEKGRFASLGMIYTHMQAPIAGYIIRQDWLDELKLPMPETFDELETVLTAFKEQKGCTAPLTFSKFGLYSLAYAYNFFFTSSDNSGSSYRKGDHIVDAMLENPEDVKAYIEKMHDWFEKGLLDPNFMSTVGYMPDAALVNNEATGVTYCMYSQIETKFTAAVEKGANLVGMPFPTVNKGDKLHMAPGALAETGMHSVSINAECKEPEYLLAAFNYLFTEPGFLLANYGKEGDTYNLVNGEVVLTEKMTSNIADGIRLYTIPTGWGPAWIEPNRQDSSFSQKVLDAQKAWTPDDTSMFIRNTVMNYTPEEKAELTDIMGDLLTYQEEYYLKVVTGAGNTDNWDEFVAQCKKLGIERATEIKDAAFSRYISRSAQ